ncbi:unnamed protein product [Chrysoparadoxa australica]
MKSSALKHRLWRLALSISLTSALWCIVSVLGDTLEEGPPNERNLQASEASSAMEFPTGHKDLLPLDIWDVVGMSVAAVGLMIAAGGGIGGGGILVPVYILLLRFEPKHAIPLSNITIFGGAITNMLLNVSKRHPLADRPLVDWDLILVMEPLTIGGAIVGSFLNKVLSETLLAVSLVVLLGYTGRRTLKKGLKVYAKESKQWEEQAKKVKESELTSMAAETGSHEEESLLGEISEESRDHGDEMDDDESFSGSHQVTDLESILEEEKTTPWNKVVTITAVFAVVLTMNLLKGGGGYNSPLGIVCGSFMFWALSLGILVWVILVSAWVRNYLVARHKRKVKARYAFQEGDVQWDERATLLYPALCFFAGFFAGLFGIGGGIVKGPLMLEMGVHPLVASATSASMILYTSFTATTSFLVFGLLTPDYAKVLFVIGLAATAVGQLIVNYFVKRYNRSSLIILSIGAVVTLSAVLMGGQSLYRFSLPNEELRKGFCG